jgi:hypothetical protein
MLAKLPEGRYGNISKFANIPGKVVFKSHPESSIRQGSDNHDPAVFHGQAIFFRGYDNAGRLARPKQHDEDDDESG